MKKVLFATTALALSAGVASAQGIELSGSAEMGIRGGDGRAESFHSDIDVTFTMSGTTDNGLTFGANIDLDESTGGAAFAEATQGGESIFLSGAFGTLTLGDTDGAFDWAMTEIVSGMAGSIGSDHEHGAYSGNGGLDGRYDGQVLRYDYSISGFGVALSAEADDNGVGDPILGIGLTYGIMLAGLEIDLGAGFQTDGNDEVIGVSAATTFDNGLRAVVNWSEGDTDGNGFDETYAGLGLGYSFGPYSVHANYAQTEENGNTDNGYGISAEYDLGGGAALQAGYGMANVGGVDMSQYSFGVSMSF